VNDTSTSSNYYLVGVLLLVLLLAVVWLQLDADLRATSVKLLTQLSAASLSVQG
jgi:surface polysaccharide O-acyltransferase-like enzyme